MTGTVRLGRRRVVAIGVAVLVAAALVVAAVLAWPRDVERAGGSPASPPAAAEGPGASPEPSAAPSEDDAERGDEGEGGDGAAPGAAAEPVDPDADFPELAEAGADERVTTGAAEVRLVGIEEVEGEPAGAGEIGGPALRVSVEVTNVGDGDLRGDLVAIGLQVGGDRAPASEVSGPGVSAFPEAIAPGEAGEATVVFSARPGERARLVVDVDPSTPAAVFTIR